MFLMPYLHGITRARFPFGVALLVVLNAIIFFSFQSGDEARYDAIVQHYAKSPLPEIEMPLYEAYLREQKEPEDADTVKRMVAASNIAPVLARMEHDEDFMRELHAGEIVTDRHPDYELWRELRAQHEAAVANVFTNHYRYDTSRPSWVSAFTHQFLHGDMGHIIGNMTVLILIGPAVEALIGTGLFLGIYLCSGFAALGMHLLVTQFAAGGLLGASGAIAGAMGAFAVLLGRRKIPFFYSVIVYFDVIRAPALLALPIWLANEAIQLLWLGNSHVAYGAHLGGLLMGATLAWPLRRRAHARLAQIPLASDAPAADVNPSLTRARRQMASLDYESARKSYALAAQAAGSDQALLQECLNVTALAPASDAYHLTVAEVLRLPGNKSDTHALVLETFRSYLQKALPVPRMRVSTLVMLADRFMRQRNLAELERCVRLLHAMAPRDPRSAETASRAAQCLADAGERAKAAGLNELFAVARA